MGTNGNVIKIIGTEGKQMKLLQELIKIYSPSSGEEKLADFILSYCASNNLAAENQKGNIVIYLKGKDQKKALIFNAHMDTVTAGNGSLWKYPPSGKTAGKLIDGKVYGLGASDDKGAIAAMLSLATSLKKPPCDVWFTFVCNEETNGSGTHDFLAWFKGSKHLAKYKTIAAILGEPTNLTSIEVGHRGSAFVTLSSYGMTGHGAKTYNDNSLAINKMLKALEKLQDVFKKWKKDYKDAILGEPSMNITRLHTPSKSLNKIPDQCFAVLDIRTTPKLHQKLDALLKDTIGQIVDISYSKKSGTPAMILPDSYIVKVFKKVLPKLPLTVSLGSNDSLQFLQVGIEAIVFGPGDKKVIHKENEYMEISKIEEAIKLYKKIIFAY